MSLSGAVRLYVVATYLIEWDVAPSDDGLVPWHGDGIWALWAQMDARVDDVDPLPPLRRVEPGPVLIAGGRVASSR